MTRVRLSPLINIHIYRYHAQLAKSAATTFGNLARVEAYRLHLVSVGAIEAIALILEWGLLDGKRCVTVVVITHSPSHSPTK